MRSTMLRIFCLATLALLFTLPAAADSLPCTVTQNDVDLDGAPDLDVRGTTGKQKLRVDINQTSTTVFLDCNGDGTFGVGAGDINGVVFGPAQTFFIKLQGYDDITFNFTGDISGQAKNLAIKLGAGINKINIGGTPTAPSVGKLLNNSALVVHIDGMVGPDTVNLMIPPVVDNSAILVRAETGDANDHVWVYSSGTITNGSIVDLKADLGGSANSFHLLQSGVIANATLQTDLQGGPGVLDIITNSLAGTIGAGGRFLFRAALNQGADKFTQNFDLGNLRILAGGEVRFRVDGEGGGDTLLFTRNGTSGTPLTLNAGVFDLGINGGSGSDKITVDLAGGGFVTTGTYRLHVDGALGSETIVLASDIAAASNPDLDVLVHGGSGTDVINFTFNNSGANGSSNYGPAGFAILDGGYFSGDKCTVTGNPLVHERNCEL
jgi:hypothetical protein